MSFAPLKFTTNNFACFSLTVPDVLVFESSLETNGIYRNYNTCCTFVCNTTVLYWPVCVCVRSTVLVYVIYAKK